MLPLCVQEVLDLVGNAGSMSQAELTQRKEDLKRQQEVCVCVCVLGRGGGKA